MIRLIVTEIPEMQACRGFKWTTLLINGKRSLDFRVGNCEWYLAINAESYGKSGKVIICPKQIQDTSFRSFKFTCFHKQSVSNIVGGLCFKVIESATEHLLWNLESYAEFTFVFFFDDDNTLELKTESDKKLDLSGLSSLSSDLGALLASGDSSDVKLMTESGSRSAHRTVLACRSEVFSAMFRSEMKDSTSGLVEIKDLDGAVFDLLLGYIYTGRFPTNLDEDILIRLYSAADKYAVHCLKKQCGYLLSRCVTQENHQALLVLADAHRDQLLKNVIIACIVEKPDWLKCEGWHQFSRQYQELAQEVLYRLRI